MPTAAMAAGSVGLALLLSGLTLVFGPIEIITETAMALPKNVDMTSNPPAGKRDE